jgi:transcriptional regulator with XRE-family HTH domain
VWHQERTIFEATERICALMDVTGVTRSELADRLGKTRSHVTQLLDGQTNMRLRTLSDVFVALGRAVHIVDGPLEPEVDKQHVVLSFMETYVWPSAGSTAFNSGIIAVPTVSQPLRFSLVAAQQ